MTSNHHRRWRRLTGLLAAGLLAAGLTGCDTTHQVSETPKDFSGFLGDYRLLTKGQSGEANYLFIDRTAPWGRYTKLYIENIDLWHSDEPDSPLGRLPRADKQMLVNFFHTALANTAAGEFQIVDHAGPDVLVVRAAITEARPSRPVFNLVSSVVTVSLVVSYAKQAITGTGTGVGAIRIEMMATDGQTGQLIGAAVDERAGTKALRTKFDGTWGDAKLCFDWWSERFVKRAAMLKQGDYNPNDLQAFHS
jgi:hypothetical protein